MTKGQRERQRKLLMMLSGGARYIDKVLSYSPIAYWPMNEASGTTAIDQVNTAQNGTYTGVTLGQTGIGDGNTCPLFDGVNDYVNIYSTAFNTAFSGAEGTVAFWPQLETATWADAATRYTHYLRVDNDNRISTVKSSTAGRMTHSYEANNTAVSVNWNAQADTAFFHIAVTWSKSGDIVTYYKSGAALGTPDTGLGTWVGALSSTTTLIGANSTVPGSPWKGKLAHFAVFDSALSAATIAILATV